MTTTMPVDTGLLMQEATRSDLVQRKLSMDSLRQRLGDQTTKEEKLRETCEGFESIFVQKLWEQMRKTVPKEGYLHSKDEETYQSMFDVELCKKMTSAGGIGLADMLYEQLSQQLEHTSRATTPGSFRPPAEITPVNTLLPEKPQAAKPVAAAAPVADKNLTAESLYSPIEEPKVATVARPESKADVLGALHELKVELGLVPNDAPGAAVQEWANQREAQVNAVPAPQQQTAAVTATEQKDSVDPTLLSWQRPGKVSVKPRPISRFPKSKSAPAPSEAVADASASRRGMTPEGTLWPLSGDNGIVSGFGWEDDAATGQRRWNSGVKIAAAPQAPVRAVLPGTVIFSGEREGQGNTIILEHQDGLKSYYSNIQENQVKAGDKVELGANIARIAVPGASSLQGENSSSLHFELKRGEMALNPEIAINRS